LFLKKRNLQQKLQNTDKKLYYYLSVDLLTPNIDKYFPSTIRDFIKMKHLLSFQELLIELCSDSMFVSVIPRYKAKLNQDKKFYKKLEDFLFRPTDKKGHLQDKKITKNFQAKKIKIFLKHLKEFILEFLTREYLAGKNNISDVISNLQYRPTVENYDRNVKWILSFEQLKTVKCKHSVDFYWKINNILRRNVL